jgi:hypothetical protein
MYTSDPRANVRQDLSIFRSKLSCDIWSGAPRLVACCTSHKVQRLTIFHNWVYWHISPFDYIVEKLASPVGGYCKAAPALHVRSLSEWGLLDLGDNSQPRNYKILLIMQFRRANWDHVVRLGQDIYSVLKHLIVINGVLGLFSKHLIKT